MQASIANFGGNNEFKYCFCQLHMWIDLTTRQMTFFSRKVRMRVNSASSQVGLGQVGPGQLGPVISYIAYYFPRYFHKG